jgi:hypothetical protein
VELDGLSTRARAFGGKEYFSRRCCRKVSAERSRIEFTALTLLLGSNNPHHRMEGLYFDLFGSKNTIVAQLLERPDHGGSA